MRCYKGAQPGWHAPEEIEVVGSASAAACFEHIEGAWDHILRDAEAAVTLAARAVLRAREEMAKTERNAADATVEFAAVKREFRAWQESRLQAQSER